ncbi:MAG: hypothetical protein A2033_16970 [Bacteroidetes bacterium GWA2_31_9]|nr:MAG: hypothetical protein A2033_16970 [Bacteroidetes bacterium GWA2_31_9]
MRLFAVIFFLFTFLSLNANVTVLKDSTASVSLSPFLTYSIDLCNNLNFNDIINKKIIWQQFKNGQTPSMGVVREPYWFKFQLINQSNRKEWYLTIDYYTLDSVSIFVCDTSDNLIYKKIKGILCKNNNEKQRVPLFNLNIEKEQKLNVYIRISTVSYMVVPIKISTPEHFFISENFSKNGFLPAYGILIAAIIFNIFLFFISREKAFLFLSLSVICSIIHYASIMGVLYELTNLSNPVLYRNARWIFSGLALALHIIFVIYYLDLKKYRKILLIEFALCGYFLLYSFISVFSIVSPVILNNLIFTNTIIFGIIQVCIGIYCLIKKNNHSKYYVASFSPFIISSITYMGMLYAWFEPNPIFNNMGLYASSVFLLILTIGITEKVSALKREKSRANQLDIDKKELEKEIAIRKSFEIALNESEMRFRKLFEMSPLPILLTELESGIIADMNIAFTEFSNISRNQLIGKTTYDLGLIDFKKRELLYNLVLKDGHVQSLEVAVNVKNEKRIVLLFMSTLELAQKKYIITVVSDITILKENEQKLRDLNITKDKFLSIIAHDLVNPFHAIMLYSKELKVYTANNERATTYNTNLIHTAQNTYNLLQNLLTWARTQTGQISFHPQKISVKEIVSETVEYAMNMANTKQIDIINEIDTDTLIEADLQMISVVMRNLISNSIKFTFNNGFVKIQFAENEDNIVLSVVDNGVGMEQQDINKLFNLYETTQKPGTVGEAGTGLGLIICNEFVKYHKGSISVKSKLGEGSTFSIILQKNKNE